MIAAVPRTPPRPRRAGPALAVGAALCLVTAWVFAQGSSDDAQLRYTQGLRGASELLEAGRTDDAIVTLRTLTARFPSRPEAFNNLAVLYARQGLLERARDLLTRSMNTHPSYATTYQNLSEVLAQLAARAYDAALDNKTGDRAPPTLALIETAAPEAPRVLAASAAPQAPVPTGSAAATVSTPTTAPPAVTVAAVPPPVTLPRAVVPGTDTAAAPELPTPSAEASSPAAPPPGPTASAAPAPPASPAATVPAREAPDPRLAEVLATVNGWARAWSDQRVDRYLSYYDAEFRPARGLSRADWKAQRQVRVTRPARIKVEVRGPSVSFQARDRARVRFRQHYRSNLLSSTVSKTLHLRKRKGRWRILEEKV